MLEHRMQAEHGKIEIARQFMEPYRLRNGMADASGAEHLKGMDDDHLAPEPGERKRFGGIEPVIDL